MKKNILNLILIIILVILPLIYMKIVTNQINNDLKNTIDTAPSVSSIKDGNGEVGDVEGYGRIATSVVKGIGIGSVIFVGFLQILLNIIAFGFGFVVLILSIIAAAIYKKKIAYRILMSIVYFLYLVIELILLGIVASHFSIAILIYSLLIPIFIGINMYNTYSKKMFEIA